MGRILIVDDTSFMREMLSDLLVEAGHVVVGTAADGNEAVRMYSELRPDLITLDITMPVKDGLTALREIREIDPCARVVICSAIKQERRVTEALEAGARDFVVKPFRKDAVIAAVANALEDG